MSIRLATADDAAAIASIYAPFVRDTAASFETVPPSDAEMRRRIEQGAGLHPWLAWEEQGSVEGYAYATPFRPRVAYRFAVETSIYLAPQLRGRGVGRQLYRRLIDILERQGFTEAIAAITLPNAASVALHEGFGFRAAGGYERVGYKGGAWHDVGLWQRPLARAGEPPEEPRPLAELQI